jgi:hypothetical protein
MHNKESGKGECIPKLKEIIKSKIHTTVCVGDYENDISMIKIADKGFAVQNAIDQVKRVASCTTVSNNDDAIAHIIYGLQVENNKKGKGGCKMENKRDKNITGTYIQSSYNARESTVLPPIEKVEIGSRGEFIVNGKPFIPIMSWLQAPESEYCSFNYLKSLNFNTFMGTTKGVTPLEHAEEAKKAGGYAVVCQHTPEQVVGAVGHSHILAWHHSDEPDMPCKNNEGIYMPRQNPETIMECYKFMRSNGINRPVFVTFTGNFMEEFQNHYDVPKKKEVYSQMVNAADVVGFDVYPIFGYGTPGWLNHPASGVKQLIQIAESRPVFIWIESGKGSKWMPYEKQPDVLPHHTHYQVWSALINGATAIGYFTHAWFPEFTSFAPTQGMKDELFQLNGQITRLSQAILAPYTNRNITVEITSNDGGNKLLLNRYMATEHEDYLYLFVQNADLGANSEKLKQYDSINPRGGSARIEVEGLFENSTVEVIDEGREITASKGCFSDKFEPLCEHIYRIRIR